MKKPDKIEAASLFEGESVKVGNKVPGDNRPDMAATDVPQRLRGGQRKGAIHYSPPRLPAPVPDTTVSSFDNAGFFLMVERIVCNKDADVDKLERVLAMRERAIDRQAKADFDAHFVDMQDELPQITKDGLISVEGTSRATGKAYKQETQYAKYETLMKNVLPVLHRHGLSLTHETSTLPDGKLRIIAVLKGYGHTEKPASIDLGADSTGSKNTSQAWISAGSYGRRFTASVALNLVIVGEDDDGWASGRPIVVGEPLTEEQAGKLIGFCDAAELAPSGLLQVLNKTRPKPHPVAATLRDIPSSRFDEAVNWVRQYEAEKGERSK
jgi:hypothetical protein